MTTSQSMQQIAADADMNCLANTH